MQNKEQLYTELLNCGNEMSNLLFLFKHMDNMNFLDKDKKLFEGLHKTWDSVSNELCRLKLQEEQSHAVHNKDKSE